MNATERFVRHISETTYDDLSPAAVSATQVFFLDTLGVSVAGSRAPFAQALHHAVSGWGEQPQATVFGSESRLPATSAALVNGFHAHSQEYDCVHEPAVVHPLASIQSAALAWAERSGGISGKELIVALNVGVDVATSLGTAARRGLVFFRPATAGIFGATAAVAKLAGASSGQILDALGIASAQCAGTMQAHIEGKPTLAMAVGMAARGGIQSVDLALAGLSGPHDVFEGAYGYFPLFEGQWDLTDELAGLGKIWRITQLSHKPFPSGRATHGGIDGIRQLKQTGLSPQRLSRLELHAPPLIQQLVGRALQTSMQASYARLCFQYVGALAWRENSVELAHFYPDYLQDSQLHELGGRISVITDDNPDPNALAPQTVIAYLDDGTQHRITVTDPIGSPANPLSHNAHVEKFRRCWQHGGLGADAGQRVIDLVDRLAALSDIGVLFPLTGTAS